MKKTKIPEDWKVYQLSEIATVERGKFTARPRNDPRYYGGHIPFVQTGDVTSSKGKIKSYSQTLNKEGLKVSKLFKKGSILVTIAANIGDVAITEIDTACPDSIVVVQAEKNFCQEWLFYYLFSCKKLLESAATQNAQKNINLQVLKPLKILLPPITEQRKIAEILGTCDRLIELTEQLITAKRKLKRGLMQKLLTGKLRFPEFVKSNKCQKYHFLSCPTDWKIYSIGEICREISNKNASPETTVLSCTKYDGLVPSLEYFGRKVYGDNLDKYKIVKKNQFAYATNHIEEGSIGLLKELEIGLVSPIYTVFETKNSCVIPDYLILILKTEFYRTIFESLTLASVDRRGSLRWKSFSKIKVAIPNIQEQKKIINLFDDLNLQINLLEKKLSYLQRQKKGLMQKLLTGKTRVKID